MKIIQIIIFTLLTFNLYSQTNKKLDDKNGFKDLKFGELISKYNESLIPISGTQDEFEYKSEIHKSLFGWYWKKCFVSSKENKLVCIGVFWSDEGNTVSPH